MLDNNKSKSLTNPDQNVTEDKNTEEQLPANTDVADVQIQKEQNSKRIDFLLDVPLQVSVEVGRTKMLIKDLLKMKEGGVIELDKMADEPLDLYVNSRLIARGEAVVVNDKFGLRLIDVVSAMERLEKLR